jgi:exodeoxyribonuclease VII small subunit
MSDKNPKKKSEPGYAEASAELELILQEIESGEIDLDLLSDKVERAAMLIALCREKLAATESKVKKVVADLAATVGNGENEGDGDDEGA